MVNRPAGGARSKKHDRAPFDWYCDHPAHVEPLFDALDFSDSLIWDPTCGRGNILDVAKGRGFATFGSDLVERGVKHDFAKGDFLTVRDLPPTRGRRLSIVNNPPYGYIDGICERIIRHALSFPVHRACFIVPIAFLCSNERWRFFSRDLRPSHVMIMSDRPTMPPGHLMDTMAKPFEGGMADYVWICYRPPHQWRTETVWLPGPRTPGAR